MPKVKSGGKSEVRSEAGSAVESEAERRTELRVERLLRWFDKTSEWLVGEEPLTRVELSELRRWFELPEDDPVYGVYPIGPSEEAWLQPRLAHVLDRDRFDYFIEASQVEVELAGEGEA